MNIFRVLIVGSGMGGLTSAFILSHRNCKVHVFESANDVGGKMRQQIISGQTIDIGPTVLTMRNVFDQIFKDVDEILDDHVLLKKAEILARHAWQDGSVLDLYSDPLKSAEAISSFSSKNFQMNSGLKRIELNECTESDTLR